MYFAIKKTYHVLIVKIVVLVSIYHRVTGVMIMVNTLTL